MEKEFIPYEQALDLKELGFDESCLAFYWITGKFYITAEYPNYVGFHKQNQLGDYNYDSISAPTFSQAFRWFREKYNLCGEVYTVNMGAIDYTFLIRDLYSEDVKYDNFDANTGGYSGTFNTYEEAELECLKELIEIVKRK